jgi:hypothetical protein
VVYSEVCRESLRQILARAAPQGKIDEVAEAVKGIIKRLEWIPLDFGEPLRDHGHLGLQERVGPVPPLVVRYGVDEARRMVYVVTPIKLLPRSGV